MDALEKSLRAFREFSDDPMLTCNQQEEIKIEFDNQGNIQGDLDINQNIDDVRNIGNPERNTVLDIAMEDNQQIISSQREILALRGDVIISDLEIFIRRQELMHKKVILNAIKTLLHTALKWNIVGSFILFLLIFTIKWDLSSLYIFLFICLVDIYTLLNHFEYSTHPHETDKRKQMFDILQSTLSVISKITLVFYSYVSPHALTFCFGMTLLFDVIYTLSLIFKYKESFLKKFYCAQLIIQTFKLVIIGTAILKIDHIIDLQYNQIFTIYKDALTIFAGINLIALLIFIKELVKCLLSRTKTDEFHVKLWLSLLFSGVSLFSLFSIQDIQGVLERKLDPSCLMPVFAIGIMYNIGIACYTTLHFTRIENYYKKIAGIQDEIEVKPEPIEEMKPTLEEQESIPQFLAKASHSFFKKVTQHEVDRARDKQNKKNPKKSRFHPESSKNVPQISFPSRNQTEQEKFAGSHNQISEIGEQKNKQHLESLQERHMMAAKLFITALADGKSKSDALRVEHNYTEEEMNNIVSRIYMTNPEDNEKGIEKPYIASLRMNDFAAKLRGNSFMNSPKFHHLGLHEVDKSSDKSKGESEIPSSLTYESSGGQQCLICFDNAPDAVFMDCGHGGLCYECSLEIWKTTHECHLCRKKIVQVLQVDLKNKIGKNIIQVITATQMLTCDNHVGTAQP